MKFSKATRRCMACGAAYLSLAFADAADAQPHRCFQNGDVVAFDGIATPGANTSQWVLHLAYPVCVADQNVSAIRIIGTPPPLGIPLELTGKLMLGHRLSESTVFAAIIVSRGRKLRAAAPAPARQRSRPLQPGAEECGAPPYGGTEREYQAFVRRFAAIIKPQKILSGICNAKFGNAPRNGLHKLGFTDSAINSESTEHLAAETILALKHLVNTIE